MLRSCRRRALPPKLCGVKILVFVGFAQFLCTCLIYLMLSYDAAVPDHSTIIADFNIEEREKAGRSTTKSNQMSKYAKSAFQRAKSAECRQLILDTERKQVKGSLYQIDKRVVGTCPARNISKSRYVGCFIDTAGSPDLSGTKSVTFSENPVDNCVEYCYALGMPYAGLKRTWTCSCGPRFGIHGAAPHSSCRPCPDDAGRRCGGNNVNSVYTTETAATSKFVAPKLPIANSTNHQPQPARIAFILSLNGRSLRQVGRLLRLIYRREHFYLIHIDGRMNYLHAHLEEMTKGVANIYMATGKDRFSTIWGGASLLTMLTKSYEFLLERSGWPWEFVINLSETDFPIRPIDNLATFLGHNRRINFVLTHVSKTETFLSKQGMLYTFVECENHMWRLSQRSPPRGIRIFGASDWVTLTREFVEYVVEGRRGNSMDSDQNLFFDTLERFYSHTLLPAESYFHTVLLNSHFCDRVANSNLRVVNWQRSRGCKCQQKAVVDWCGCSPNVIQASDFPAMLNYAKSSKQQFYFARKFEEVISQSIVNKIEVDLLQSTESPLVNFDHFWQSEYLRSTDSEESPAFVKKHAFFKAFSHLGLLELKNRTKSSVTTNCPLADVIDRFFSADILMIKNRFDSYLLDFIIDSRSFQVRIVESGEALGRVSKLHDSLDTVKNDKLFEFSENLGFRLSSVSVGSDFDVKELVFRNYARLLQTGVSNACVALSWEKVASSNSQNGTSTKNPKDLSVSISILVKSPDGSQTQCSTHPKPAEQVTCVCTLELKQAGVWELALSGPNSLRLGSSVKFVVLPSSSDPSFNSSVQVGMLSPAFWQVADVCVVESSLEQDLKSCFDPPVTRCESHHWSTYADDPKSKPIF